MGENLLDIRDLQVIYRSDRAIVRAVNGISFSVKPRETVGIAGETGAGKTTTAMAILRLLPKKNSEITAGEIWYHGEDLLKKPEKEMRLIRGACISMIFQDPMTSLNPVKTIGDQILESLKIHYTDTRPEAMNKRVDELLSMVNISPSRKHDYPHQFSGGMKQRVVIAISLACNPQLIIADEPTTALDVTIQAQVLAMINELKERLGTSMIMITHDLGVVAETCDRVAIMYAGEIVEQGRVEDVFSDKPHHPYTAGLFGAIPDLELESERLTPIDGLMPDPVALPPGCKFHTRCKNRMPVCERSSPGVWCVEEHSIRCHLYAEEAS